MEPDVELIRDLLLALDERQVSPRMTVVIALDEAARDLGRTPEAVARGLDLLLERAYIDGPGQTEPGFWLFRKLTRKGTSFVREARAPAAWARLKRHYTA